MFERAPFYQGDSDFDMVRQINKHLGTTRLLQMMDRHQVRWPFNKALAWKNGVKWDKFINDDNKHKVSDEALDLLSLMLMIDLVRLFLILL